MKVLNFGSLNIDYGYSGDHFVRAGETLSSEKMEKFCGGKGLNQSIALARAGAPVYHAGIVGAEGKMLTDVLEQYGVNTQFVKKSPSSNGHAIIQIDKNGQNCILLYGGTNREITPEMVDEVLENFSAGDILVLQNEINCMDTILQKAHEKGMRIALNPSPIDESLKELPLEYVTWFLLNEVEGNELTGETDPETIAVKLREKYPAGRIGLTLGKQGVLYYDGGEFLRHGIYPTKVVDTTAAGDTFTGFFLSCVLQGKSEAIALELASKASSIAVSIKGAANSIPTMEEVLDFKL